jgi:ADP-heptose:LPS heptosyltransferase
VLVAVLRLVDYLLARVVRQRSGDPLIPRTILVMKPDHLGDLLMVTAVLPLLAERFPGAAIDLLCGPWGKAVVANNRWLRHIIPLHHWAYDRRAVSLARKLLDFLWSVGHTITVLRRERYDLCLNLRDAGGDLILLARLAGCRHIIGHATGGFGPLLDRVVPWEEGRHEVEHYLEVLRPLGIQADLAFLRYELYPLPADETVVAHLLAGIGAPFAVIHPGSGDPRKLRSVTYWVAVIAAIDPSVRVLVTGTSDEQPLFSAIASKSERQLVSLMGQLSVPQLYLLFCRATAVYALDSLAAHLGAAAGVPTTVFWSATNDPQQWRPLGAAVELRLNSESGA